MPDTQYLSMDQIAPGPASTPSPAQLPAPLPASTTAPKAESTDYLPISQASGLAKKDRSYLGAASESGLRSLAAAGARIVDSLNPFTLDEEQAATLYKNNPDRLKEITQHSASMALARYAQEQTARAREVMGQVSPTETGAVSGKPLGELEYSTLDPEKAAYLSPTRVAGDVLQSLPSTLALAVSAYFTKGQSAKAGALATEQALAKGATQAQAQVAGRQAAISTGAEVMAKTGAAGEGAIGYGQQMNQAIDEGNQLKPEVLEQSPAYQELITQGFSPEAARLKLIGQTGRESGLIAGAVDAATNLVGGRFLGKIIGEGGGLVNRTLKGIATEAGTETLQSGGEQLGQNYAVQKNLNPNQDLLEGVGESMAAGAVVGGVTGGGTAALFGSRQRLMQEDAAREALREARSAGEAAKAADELSGNLDEILHQTVMSDLKPAISADLAIKPTTLSEPTAQEPMSGPMRGPLSLKDQQAYIDRQAELTAQANTAPTEFDRQSAIEQASVGLPSEASTSNGFVDLTPMNPQQAQSRLAVMRDMAANAGGNALNLVIKAHPSMEGKFAIGTRELPSLDLPENPSAPIQDVQHRLESAALTGKIDKSIEEDRQSRQVVIDRALRNVEARGGVASPMEALIFHQAGIGKPYDTVDTSLAPALSTDERLTQATGIPLEKTPKSTGTETQRVEAIQAANNESMANLKERTASLKEQAARNLETQVAATAPMNPQDKALLAKAKNAPYLLSLEDKNRIAELKNPPAQETSATVAPLDTTLMGERTASALGLEAPVPNTIVQSDAKLSTTRDGATNEVTDNGVKHELIFVPSGQGAGMSSLIKQLARRFGKHVVFFNSDTLKADGFVLKADNKSIYINAKSQMSPLAVFGHELLHLIRNDNPIAYKAIARVIASKMDSETRASFRKDYGKGANIEELSADLMGNAFQDPQFLTDVFTEIAKSAPEGEARGIVMRLISSIQKAINQALDLIQSMPNASQKFKADEIVKNLEGIRVALKSALVTYAKEQKIPAMQLEAEQMKTQVGLDLSSEPKVETDIEALSPPRVSDNGHKRELESGRYVGAPDWVGNSPQQLSALRRKLRKLALDGESGRMWYEKSSKAVLDLVGGDKKDAEKFVGLLAIYSQGTEVNINLGFALEAYYQWKSGLPINTGRFPTEQSKKAQAWLDEGRDWGGIKVNNFYADLMEEIDPSKFDAGHATMDMWMALAFDYGMKVLDQGPKYNFAKREVTRLADQLGWKPHQVQAAIWTAIKSRVESSEKERNAFEIEEGIAVKNKNSHSIVKGREAEHFHAAHQFGMESSITKEEIAAKGLDFADALNNRAAQMSWEATPSVTGGDIPGIHTASTSQKMEYLEAVSKVLLKDGRDQIADMLNLHTPPTIFGYSAWEGAIGAGAQSFFPVPVTGLNADRGVLPVAKDLLNKYAAIKGYVLKQDALVWHVPVYGDAKRRENAIEIIGTRPMTEKEMSDLYNAIYDEFGTWDLAPGYTLSGARVLNFTDLSNVDFQKRMEQVIDRLGEQYPDFIGEQAIRTKRFRSDGDYISNDWKENPNGESYTSRFSQEGRSDLYERSASLRAGIEAVNEDFNKRYGWGQTKALGSGQSTPDDKSELKKSKQRIAGDSKRAYTPEQRAMFQEVGRTVEVPTLKEKLKELRQDFAQKLAQGLADQFSPLNDLSSKAYQLARLSKGAVGAFEALLQHGKLSLVNGVYDSDMSGGFIDRVGVPLQGELEDFLWWVAGNRAERLAKEDRERLFTPDSIKAAKSLSSGKTQFDYVLQHGPDKGSGTRNRDDIYQDAAKTFDEFNKNTLDMAEESGLIDKDSRAFWEHEFYVPFYRQGEESGVSVGAQVKQGLVRQEAFKRLKGGAGKLNSDLLANTLANWGHLIDASAKNRAGLESLNSAVNLGVAVEADEKTARQMAKSMGKSSNVVSVMDEGRERFYFVEDKAVMIAITSLEYSGMRGPIMDALSFFKHWLTVGVTASPPFKIRNLVRDSVQSIASAKMSYNIPGNLVRGFKASSRSSQTYVSALAGGGLIRFGTMLDGSESKRTAQLIKMGVKDSNILDSESKVKAIYERFIAPSVMAYNELGNRGEEINRAALYEQLIKDGMDHGEASFLARDLMDFSLQGSWTTVRFLTQVVPFMGARIQGMYKLGRAAKEDPARFATVLGAVALLSISLMAAYEDDEDWKKREDWDRNNYWWFKMGGVALRIPKPFEIGAIATLAERGIEYFTSPEMTGERLRKNVLSILGDNLNMNPIPQAVKPIMDIYANKDSFTKRPIETMGMERLEPQYRFTSGTSMVARGLSTGTGGVLSPVQYDHLIRGYLSWLGSFVVGAADMAIRPLTKEASRPEADYWKTATGGIVSDLKSGSSRYVTQMYEQASEIEQAYGTYKMLMKTGRLEEGREYLKSHKDEIYKFNSIEQVKRAEARYNELIRMIERSSIEPGAKKEKIEQIQAKKDKSAKLVAVGVR